MLASALNPSRTAAADSVRIPPAGTQPHSAWSTAARRIAAQLLYTNQLDAGKLLMTTSLHNLPLAQPPQQ